MQEDGDKAVMDGCLKRALIGLVRVVTRLYRKWPGGPAKRDATFFSSAGPAFWDSGRLLVGALDCAAPGATLCREEICNIEQPRMENPALAKCSL